MGFQSSIEYCIPSLQENSCAESHDACIPCFIDWFFEVHVSLDWFYLVVGLKIHM
jgi:hypothetical protein